MIFFGGAMDPSNKPFVSQLCENNSGYESQRLLDQYLLFHYGTPEQILEGATVFDGQEVQGLDFPVASVRDTLIFDLLGDRSEGVLRALDVGCAVGRSSFELSRFCDEVIALDYSQAFVEAAEQIRGGQEVKLMRYEQGQLGTELTVRCPERANPERVKFAVGDAMNLPADLGKFDVVHAANLLCRLGEPTRFLDRLPELVKAGGQLIMATPCTWSEDYTPQANQPTGKTLDFIHSRLDDAFELKQEIELPFVIRDHARKFQLSTSQTTVWVRK